MTISVVSQQKGYEDVEWVNVSTIAKHKEQNKQKAEINSVSLGKNQANLIEDSTVFE